MINLENIDIKSHIIESVVNIFDTMVSMKIEHSESEPQDTGDADRVVAAVDFAGNVAGILNIQVTTDLARRMTANRLDKEPAELEGDGEIKDLFSEISNIVAGSLKSALNDVGLTCVLSAPSMTYEGDFTIKSLNMERFERLVFLHQQNWIFVEVGLNTQPGAEDGEENPQDKEAGELESVSETVTQPETNTVRSEATAAESQKPPGPPPTAQQVDHPPAAAQEPKSCEDVDLDLLLDIPLEIKVELGRAKIQIQELLSLAPGSAVKLIKLEGEPVDLFANETLIARGEVVVQNEKYGIRVTEITSRLDRIRSFGS